LRDEIGAEDAPPPHIPDCPAACFISGRPASPFSRGISGAPNHDWFGGRAYAPTAPTVSDERDLNDKRIDATMMNCSATLKMTLLAAGLAVSAPLAAHGQAQGAQDGNIASFKAVYKLAFAPANAQSPFKSGQGRLIIELTGSRCTDYRMIRTSKGTLNTGDGPINFQSDATFAENSAGTQLAFSVQEHANGKMQRQYSGVARKNDNGGFTLTSRTLPGGKAELPKGTFLPIHHERLVAAAVSTERKNMAFNVFNPEESITGIEQYAYTFGPENKNALPKGHPADIDGLRDKPRRRIELIFRDPKTGKVRVQERMTRFANAILTVSEAVTDKLKIKASLESLTLLPQKPCP
jgi:hypothetical protein